jgi:ketosteroid isomerase-like protein
MPTFMFTYRMPADYVPGEPETMAAWTAWFESMGETLADIGKPVVESAGLGNCGAGTRLGGYSFVTADDLESAVAVAKRSPALDAGGGVEVGVVTELNAGAAPASRAERMKTRNSAAISVARAHIDAWSHHDWEKTRELLAPDVHAWVTSTQAGFGTAELTGIDAYMEPKIKAAQLIEPGSVHEICAIGDEHNALILVTFRIGLGPGGAMVTMARSCLYLLDEDGKITEERDTFYILPEENE